MQLTPDETALFGKFLEGASDGNAKFLQGLTQHEQNSLFDLVDLAISSGALSQQAVSYLWQKDYHEKPIDPATFLEDPYYYGNQIEGLFPCWNRELRYVLDPKSGIKEWCFTGDTQVALLDGTTPTLRELADRRDKEFWVYSINAEGAIVPGRAHSARKTRNKANLVEVELDSGARIRCTPDHRFMLRNGSYKEAFLLSPGDSLMPLYYDDHRAVDVRRIDEEEDVYCLTVDEHHNFALASGVFVRNCVGGGIGVGKTSAAIVAMCMKLVNLTKLKNPQRFYNQMQSSIICFGLFSLTLDKTDFALLAQFQETLTKIPYFKDKFKVVKARKRGHIEEQIQFPKDIMLWSGSNPSHALSMNMFAAILDEQNFREGVKRKPYKESVAYKLYDQVNQRLASRFEHAPTLLINISSAETQQSFLADHVALRQKSRDRTTFHFSRFALWEAREKEYRDYPRFRVAVGNNKVSHRILDDTEAIPETQQVIEVPTKLRSKFEEDLESSLKNLAGLDLIGEGKLISIPERLQACFKRGADLGIIHPFTQDRIALGLDSEANIRDFFIEDVAIEQVGRERRPIRHPDAPRFVHVDLAKNGDACGLSVVHCSSTSSTKKFSLRWKTQEISYFVPDIEVDFVIDFIAPPGDQIDFQKIVDFIIWLRDGLGYRIGRVSYDGWQSTHSLQILQKNRFKNTKVVSVDRKDIEYLMLRSCIYVGKLALYHHPILENQLLNLIHYEDIRKVDHVKGLGKDIADGLCGAVEGCIMGATQPSITEHPIDPAVVLHTANRTSGERKTPGWILRDYSLPVDKRIAHIAPRRQW